MHSPANSSDSTTYIPSGNRAIDALVARGFSVTVEHFRCSQVDFNRSWEKAQEVIKSGGTINKKYDILLTQQAISYAVKPPSTEVSARGGETVVTIEKDGQKYAGRALCSIFDNFDRTGGVARACKRALANWKEDNKVSTSNISFEPEIVPVVLDFTQKN